jgi:integrase
MGMVFRKKYKDRKTGEVRECATFTIRFYVNGRPVQMSSGSEREGDARRLLKKYEGDAANGVQVTSQMDRIRSDGALDAVLTNYQINRKKSYDDVKRRIDLHLKPWLANRRMVEIGSDTVGKYVAHRQEEGAANATINRELAALKRAFTLAMRARKIGSRPFIEMLKEDNTRRGFFERRQFEAMREKLPADLQPVATFAYLTGWRMRSEILPLEWRQVDWAGRSVRLDPGTTKSGEGRMFPFTVELEQVLKDQLVEHDRLKKEDRIIARVFHRNGEPIVSMRKAWISACKAAGVPGRIPHDLRRTRVRDMERAGVSRSAAMAMVGHRTQSIYTRYAITDAVMLREAAAKLDRAAGIMPPSEETKEGRTA